MYVSCGVCVYVATRDNRECTEDYLENTHESLFAQMSAHLPVSEVPGEVRVQQAVVPRSATTWPTKTVTQIPAGALTQAPDSLRLLEEKLTRKRLP